MVTQNTNLPLANYLPIPVRANNILILSEIFGSMTGFGGCLLSILPYSTCEKYGNIFAYLPV
jgi:hypothetical protein